MATDVRVVSDEAGQGTLQDEARALVVIRRLLMAGFVAVLGLEAWLAWEFFRSLP